jgi:polyisoprenoid-binding protein YceI
VLKVCCALSLLVVVFGRPLAADETRYRVVPEESTLEILVFRAGALAKLGHNHVITSHVAGSVVVGDSPGGSSIELSLPVGSLTVDDPEARAGAGSAFGSEISEKDREATRRNMLGRKLLDAERYPCVRIVSQQISGDFPDMRIRAEIGIKGESHEVELPASAELRGDRLVAAGRTDIAHSELGLDPFSAGFGTLRVAGKMSFRYRIVATRERWRHAASVHLPLFSTIESRALTEQRNDTMFRSCHISVVSVSPG